MIVTTTIAIIAAESLHIAVAVLDKITVGKQRIKLNF